MSFQQWLIAAHCAVAFFTVCLMAYTKPAPAERLAGQRGGFALAGNWVYWLSGPLLRAAASGRLGPMFLTIVGFLFGLGAGLACAFQLWGLAGILLLWSGFCDILDGQLARNLGVSSPAGAFVDSVLDRLGECAVFMGLALASPAAIPTALSVGALVASYTVSYTRARGEGLGVGCPSGGFERPGRVVLLFLSLMGCAFLPATEAFYVVQAAVGIVAIGASYTAIHRLVVMYRRLSAASWAPAAGKSDKAGGGRQVEDGVHVRHSVNMPSHPPEEAKAEAPRSPRYTW